MNGLAFWPLGVVLLGAIVLMSLTFELQRRTRNAGYVDVVWAAGLGAAAVFYALVGQGAMLPRILVAVLAGAWAARLSWFLLKRVRGEAEDGRYRYLREHWQDDQRKFFAFFMLQAGFTALFSLPFLVAAANPQAHVDVWMIGGVVLFVASLAGEALADHQLAQHRHDPNGRGRACRRGLWRYSRHPNYFFEWLHWFAWVLLSVHSPLPGLALLGPLLMGASLVWITGIPFTEAQSLRSRGDDYRRYQQETSMFFPWFPRRLSNSAAN